MGASVRTTALPDATVVGFAALPESHTLRILRFPLKLLQGTAILSLREIGGSNHVDRYVCRDDCLAQRHGNGADGGR